MNKVYRVIWSHVTNTFIAVSELATSKGKVKSFSAISSNPQSELNSSIPATFKLSAIALLSILTLSPAQVFAEDVIADNLTVNQTSNFKGAATFDTATFKSIATTTLTVGGKTVATDEKVTTLTETVNQKANQTDVNELKTDKADKSVVDGLSTEVNTLKTNKADKSEINTLKTSKADKSVVDGLTTEVNTLKNTKADKSELTKLSNLVTSLGVPEGTTTYTGIKYFRAKSELEDAAAEGKDSLAIGPKAKTGKTATDSVALGHDSTANATESIAIGKKAYAVKTANKGIAIGEHARVGSKQDGDVVYDGASSYVLGPKDGESSVAIGDKAVSRGEASIAIGKNAITSNKDVKKIISKNNIALGTSAQAIASDNSIALGNTSRVNKDSDSSVAIGDAAETFAESAVALGKTAQAKGVASVALGLNAKSHTASTVAIGKDSEALSSQSIAIGELAKAMTNKTISIGLNAGKGQESDKEGTKHSHINIGENAGENVIGQYNIGIGTEAGKGVVGKANIALGIYAGTNLANSKETVGDNVSIGNASNNYKTATPIQRGTAVGAQSLSASDATALGYDTKATGLKSTAVGFSADAEGEQAVAIGANAKSDANNVALGANSLAKASNKSGYLTGKNSSLVVSVGSQEGNANQHILRRLTNVADGADEQDAVTIAQLKRVSEDVTTKLQAQFNNLAHSSATSDVKYDLVSPDPNSGANHKITLKENTRLSNVAPAINGTDAVNLNQLRDTINTEKTHYFSVNDKDLTDRPSNYDNDGAVGKLSMAIGQSVIARKERSVAIGNQASAHGVGSIAIGTLYVGSPELDDGKAQSSATNAAISNQPYQYGLAIGAGANSEGNNSLAIGSLAATSNKDIQNGNVDRAIAIGYRAVSSAEKANAIGDRAVANSLTGNAFGSEAFSGAVSSNAIGTKANATGENSIAFGTHQNVTGANSGSIGYAGALGNKETTVISGEGTYSLGNTNSTLTANASGIFGNSNEIKAKENARIVGNKNTIGAIEEKAHVPGTPPAAPANDLKDIYVTGYDNKISSDKKLAKDLSGLFVYGHNNKVAQLPDPDSTEEFTLTDSSVIGANNTLNTKGKNYFVLGNNVTATLENSVYLGADSAYTTGNSTSSMNAYADMANGLNKSGYTFAGSQPVGVVTVGAVGKERRVQNVAAGLVTEASTDAINGSQLFALTRPLRFAGDHSTLSNPNGKPDTDTTVISRSSNQGMKIVGGENDGNKLTTIADKNIGVIANGDDTLEVRLAKTLSNLKDATFGTGTDKTTINKDGMTITNGANTVSLTEGGLNNGGNKITNVAAGDNDTDAVNVKQLNDLKAEGFGLIGEDGQTIKQALGTAIKVTGDNNVNTKILKEGNNPTGLEISLANNVKLGKAPEGTTAGEAGKVTLTDDKGKERAKLDGTDGSLTLTGNAPGTAPADAPSAKIKVATGKADLVGTPNDDPNNAPNNKTRITYEIPGAQPTDPATIEELATLNDGLKFGANDGAVHNAKLNSRVDVKGHANNTTWADFDAGQNIMTQIQGNTITVALAKALKDLTSASFVGGTNNTSSVLNGNGLTITKKADAQDPNAKDTVVSLTEKGLDNGGNQIVNVASGLKNKDGDAVALKDATGDVLNNGVNVGDLKDAITNITSATNGGFGLKDKEGNEFKQDLGTAAQITGDDNINTKVVDGKNGGKALEVSLADNITLGKPTEGGVEGVDGSVKVTGKDGASVVLNGKDGTIGLTGPRGADGKSVSTDIGVKEGAAGVDGTDGANGTSKTRIVYTLKDKDGNPIKDANDQPITEEVATLNDGMKFEGNDGTVVTRKLNETLGIKGGIDATTVKDNSKVSSGNLGVRAVKDDQGNPTGSLEVVMKERPEFSGIVLNGKDGQDASIKFTDKDGNESLSMTTTKDKDGNATLSLVNPTADKFVKITGVAEGDISPTSKDAVNGSQLHAVKETAELAASGWNISVNENANNNVSNVKPKHTVDLNNTDGNIVISKTVDNDKHNVTFDLANKVVIGPKDGTNQPQEGAVVISGKEGADGKGSISIAGKDGKDAVAISGKDGVGTIGLTGPAGADGKNANAIIGVKDSVKGLDGNDGKDGNSKTRIVYTKPDGTEEQVATMNDGLVFGADKGTEHKAKLGTTVKVKGDDKNIETEVAGDTIRVRLKDNIDVKGINVTENLTVKEGAKINMGNNVIDGVADGEVSATSKQAVNGSQLHKVQQQVNNQATAINKLGDHINKVDKDLRAGIAGATAVAFLQRPNEAGKSIVSLGVGSYRSESAIAVGYARNSDNNKISIKLGGGMNSRGDVNFGGSIGYQW
ncbi:YadA-like family protein [Pasteurella multocida subsp. multocida]|uniref:YadA-like family protein n=1 Tax=Pasteurella multocida TaxID=747 RepID=A0A9X3UPB3_PASMD|nr:YadA-like family protein [Pasteurella multocida]MBF6980035.1 YadA-like family protein [Pasteurella multocida]MDA5617612.1 YadA-like family protein [Pasteurella multocida subsp. multocida]MDA5619560.1 YadA-like family protein [Pasteurella multocida subsp. multocida]MDA5622647.1 YadA-like family protein [Pasteurella multocida]